MVTEAELREQLEDALEDILCFCGNYKRMGKPFCFRCFDSLPKQQQWSISEVMRQVEWKVHNDMHHRYDAAKQWLKKHQATPSRDLSA